MTLPDFAVEELRRRNREQAESLVILSLSLVLGVRQTDDILVSGNPGIPALGRSRH
jgi:hypothetical protein